MPKIMYKDKNYSTGSGGDITVDEQLNKESTNPVQNKVVTDALNNKLNIDDITTTISDESTDDEIPTAKAVYEVVGKKNITGKQGNVIGFDSSGNQISSVVGGTNLLHGTKQNDVVFLDPYGRATLDTDDEGYSIINFVGISSTYMIAYYATDMIATTHSDGNIISDTVKVGKYIWSFDIKTNNKQLFSPQLRLYHKQNNS